MPHINALQKIPEGKQMAPFACTVSSNIFILLLCIRMYNRCFANIIWLTCAKLSSIISCTVKMYDFFPLCPSSFAKYSCSLSKHILKKVWPAVEIDTLIWKAIWYVFFGLLLQAGLLMLPNFFAPQIHSVRIKAFSFGLAKCYQINIRRMKNTKCEMRCWTNPSIMQMQSWRPNGVQTHHVRYTLTYLWSNDISLSLFHFFTRSFGSIHIITAVSSPHNVEKVCINHLAFLLFNSFSLIRSNTLFHSACLPLTYIALLVVIKLFSLLFSPSNGRNGYEKMCMCLREAK